MNNIRGVYHIVLILSFLTFNVKVWAQDGIISQSLQEEEQNTLQALALYPASERTVILDASTHPEILVRMQNIQAKTKQGVKSMISDIPQEDQRSLYNLFRYPELIDDILKGDERKSSTEMNELLKTYPEEIHKDALLGNKQYFSLLVDINNLYNVSEQTFESILSSYPLKVQDTYRSLVKLPEVLTVLSENMNLTVLLGDLYKKNPEAILKELDSLNVIAAEQKSKELNEWKQSLKDNPDALAEYEKASKEFAQEEGFHESDYQEASPGMYTNDIYIHHIWHPYPYWFGWPWWYTYEYWYPYPFWYHMGFYYGTGNVIVIVGMPSDFYMHWHFRHYRHFYSYPHFTNHTVKYYYGHRRSMNSVTKSVGTWIETGSNAELPKDWLSNDKDRVDRIKEYGRFNMEYESMVAETKRQDVTRKDYLDDNAGRYPVLNSAIKEKSPQISSPAQESKKEWERREPKTPVIQPREKTGEIVRPDYPVINRAKDYHQNTWEKSRTQPKQIVPVTPEKRTAPVPQEPRKIPVQPSPEKKSEPRKK